MKPQVQSLWHRACKAIETAAKVVEDDPDAAASRAYCAAFYAVSAMFAEEGRWHRKHRGLEAAVHRDLVNTGKWSHDLGAAYSTLLRVRATGDYGAERHVPIAEAKKAVAEAGRILQAVRDALPELESETERRQS